MDKLFWILGIVVALAGGLYGGYVFGGKRMKKEIEDKIGRTEDAMKKLVDEATNKAEAVKKEKVLEAKEEILRQKTETEKELRDRRAETQRTERRLLQREEMLDKKMDNLEVREDSLNKTSRELEQRAQEVEALRVKQQSELERIAQMTAEEARQIIMNNVQREAYRDAAVMVREIESKAKDGADKKARNIISLAIQKCAVACPHLILIACDLCRRQINCNLLMLLVKHCDFLRIINILHLNITFGSKNTSHSVRNFTGTTLQGSHTVAFKYHSNSIQHIHTFTENSSCLYIL